jgi:hypothetical protein
MEEKNQIANWKLGCADGIQFLTSVVIILLSNLGRDYIARLKTNLKVPRIVHHRPPFISLINTIGNGGIQLILPV